MTESGSQGPVLFCYDGSAGSRGAMRAAAGLIAPSLEAVVLTVWEPIALRLALGGAFVPGSFPSEGDIDSEEEALAKAASEEGAARAAEHGFKATAMTVPATEGVSHAVMAVADDISARLIVCGQRGRGPVRTALLGSVSHALAAHTRRPVLVAPEEVV